MLVTKNGKQDEKDRRKDRKEQNIIKSCWVTAKSLQKINGKKNIFLIIDSGSTEQQVLHIKYLKFHQKTAVLQHNVQKHLGSKCSAGQWQNLSSDSSCALPSVSKTLNPSKKFHKQWEPPPPPTHTFGMEKTSLTRYKIDVSKWNSVHAFYTRQIHTEPISHVLMEKKKRKPALKKRKRNKLSKQKPALQLLTCVQLATEHVKDQKTDTNPNKKECLQHQVSVSNWVWQEGGSKQGFPVKFPTRI